MLPEWVVTKVGGGGGVSKSLAPLFGAFLETKVCWFEKEDPIVDQRILTVFPVLGASHQARRIFLELANKGCPVVYYAQGWGEGSYSLSGVLPMGTPVICVSKFLISKWAMRLPSSPLFYLPPVMDPVPTNQGPRDIDVLVFKRKMDDHVYEVVNMIKDKCNVHIQESLIPLHAVHTLFNRSKVYIYCVPPILALGGPEGFGMQPVEARILGCHVFSSLFGGLAENIDTSQPKMSQIGIGVDLDAARILKAVDEFTIGDTQEVRDQFSCRSAEKRVGRILKVLDLYYTKKAP
jgi:hypothetical protein